MEKKKVASYRFEVDKGGWRTVRYNGDGKKGGFSS
jgi:hypothetical protein